jgi:hypothetical protein
MMFPFLLLVAVGFVVWTLMAPGRAFLPAFANLLAEPVLQQSPLSFFSGRSYVLGRFGKREIAIRLQQKRGRYQVGYLVIAVQTGGPRTLDASGIEAHTRDEPGRHALFTIAANDLPLSVESGWLKALWMPAGLVIFPGRFEEDKWRRVLEAMVAVAVSLEAPAPDSITSTGGQEPS